MHNPNELGINSPEQTILRPSLTELKSICKVVLRLAPTLDITFFVKLIEVGVEGPERLGYMLAYVAACVALSDGLAGKGTDGEETQLMLADRLPSETHRVAARESIESLKTALLKRLHELYPRLDIQGMLQTLQC